MTEYRTMPMIWADDLYGRSNDPCAACGKHLKEGGTRYEIHVIHGGSSVLHPKDEHLYIEDAGELGLHSVGPECRKKFGEFAVKRGKS